MNLIKLDAALCGDIWTRDTMDELLADIASFGHRFTGSAGEKKAQQILRRKMKGWGIETRFQRFKVDTWERGPAELTLPDLGVDLPCLGFVFSGSTGKKARSFDVVDLFDGSPGDFKRNKTSLTGKAVLFSRKDYVERDKKEGMWRYKTALEQGAAAFIAGTFRWPGVISAASLRLPDWKGPMPPAVTVSGESVELLKRAMAHGKGRVTLRTEGKPVQKFSGNVVGELPGRRSDQAVVLGAHLDSFDIATGADDNGSGVAVVCEVARLLATHKVALERPVRFVFFTGEELGRLGSIKYADSLAPGEVGIYYNFDLPANGGFPALLTMMKKSDPGFWFRLQEKMRYRFSVREIHARASDHYSFYRRGIPCIWEISQKSGSRSPAAMHHTAHDNLEFVNSNELKEAATMAAKVVLYLACRKPFPFKSFKPDEHEKVPHFS